MLPAAAVLAAVLVLLLLAAAPALSAASWPVRAPLPALLLWQALGLAFGLLALEAATTVALAPFGDDLLDALRRRTGTTRWWSVLAAVVAVVVFLRLLTVLVVSTTKTVRDRHRHRVALDLVATRNPLLWGASVVDHDLPVAYCLPGLRPRVVVSRGVLTSLREDELRAVLAHELAHLSQRHDLVVLPFVALRATFPWLPPVRTAAAQVAVLVEMLADDAAARGRDPRVLARALCKVGEARVPSGGLGVSGSPVVARAARLLDPPRALGRPATALVLLAAGVVLLLPAAGLVLPLAL